MTSEPITTKGYCAMQTQIKVRGYHLDVYQHVNNARYLEFLEEARWDGLGEQRKLPVANRTQHRVCGRQYQH